MDLITLALAKKYTNGQIDIVNTDIGEIETALSGKSDKAATPTAGHIATLDASGNVTDGGTALTDVTTQLAENTASVANVAPLDNFDALNATAKKIRVAQSPSTLTMSLMSDTHYNSADTNAAVKIATASGMGMLGNYVGVDVIGNLGDFLRGNEVKDTTLSDLNKIVAATNQNAKRRVLYARGNHDDNGWYSYGGYGGTYQADEMISPLEWFQNAFSFCAADIVVDAVNPTGGYGYYDHAPSKIRIFVLNSEDIPYILIDGAYKYNSYSSGHCFSDAQLNFVADALHFADKDVPNDWAAMFLMHTPMDTDNTNGYRFGINDSLIRGHEAMLAIIKAYKNGSSFAFAGSTYNSSLGDTQADFMIDVSADYSSKGCGDVVAFISGHTHADNFSRDVGFPRSLSRGYTFLSLEGSTAFANYVVDRANNRIKVVKHGASIPDTTTGAAVGVPDEGIIADGEWSVNFDQFRPAGDNLFAGFDSAGSGYNFDVVSNPPISLDTMEVTGRKADANVIMTKAIPVSPFTKYAIPSGFNGVIFAYGPTGAKSGAITHVAGDEYKIVTTGIRQYYLVFSFHMPTYTDYANFKIKEIYSGLEF